MTTAMSSPVRFGLDRRSINLPLATRDLADRLVTLRRAVRAAKWNKVLDVSLEAVGAGHAHALALADLDAHGAANIAWTVERAQRSPAPSGR